MYSWNKKHAYSIIFCIWHFCTTKEINRHQASDVVYFLLLTNYQLTWQLFDVTVYETGAYETVNVSQVS